MPKKILFVVTSHGELGNSGKTTGYWLSEVTHPWSVLSQKFEIDVVSPLGGKPPVDGFDLSDPINKKYWEDKAWQAKMATTMTPGVVKPDEYCAIFYAGGHGAMWDFPDNQVLSAIAGIIYDNGGYVSGVCHGPAGLLNIYLKNGHNLIKGKKLDSFTNEEELANGTAEVVPFMLQSQLEKRGCLFDNGPMWSDHVIVDGRLVTGQNPFSALTLGKTLLKLLENG